MQRVPSPSLPDRYPGVSNFVFLGEAGCGKSEAALNLAPLLHRERGAPVHFFDLDMTKPLFRSRDRASALTGLLVVPDTEVPGRDTLYGRLDFLQLVGITQRELDVLRQDPSQAPVLAQRLGADDPWLLTDLDRTRDYL